MVGLILSAVVLSGCFRSTPKGFDAAAPEGRLDAIVRAAREKDRSAVPDLVVQLESDDPAVRTLAITALEHITGETLGYRQEAPEAERRVAVDRWQQWTVAQGLVPASKEAARP